MQRSWTSLVWNIAVLFLNFSTQELNTKNETIVLADAQAAVSADDVNKHVPGDKGRYIFYLFKHTFEGDYMESIGKWKREGFLFFRINNDFVMLRQVKTSDIISRRFGDFMTPLSRLQMRIKLTNARTRVTTQSDLHSGVGYTNTLARIESACTFKLGVNCLM